MTPKSTSDPRTASLWIVSGLAMGPAIALGLARFAYALLLPMMRSDLGWSYANAGAMNTANAAGYLIGALAATPVARRFGVKQTFMAGIFLTAFCILGSGLTSQFAALMGLRVLAGITGALAFLAGGSIAAAVSGSAARAPLALGIYFSGGGVGIAMSALSVPMLRARHGLVAPRDGGASAAVVEQPHDRLLVRPSLRRLVPVRHHRGHLICPPRSASASMDQSDRRAHRRLWHRTMRRPNAERLSFRRPSRRAAGTRSLGRDSHRLGNGHRLSARARAGMIDEDGAEIIDVGQGRSGDHRIADLAEKSMCVIVRQHVMRS